MEFANDLLEQSLGKEKAGAILENVKQSMNSVPFGFPAEGRSRKPADVHLRRASADDRADHVASARGAGGRGAERAAVEQAARSHPPHRHDGADQPRSHADVERSLEGRMTSTFNQQLEKAGGVSTVAQILNVTDRMTNKGDSGKPGTGKTPIWSTRSAG